MKCIIICLSIILTFVSCREEQQKENMFATYDAIKINPQVDSLYKVFISKSDSNNMFDLYIDRISWEQSILVFTSGPNVNFYSKKLPALFYTYINNKKVFIHSGLEDIIKIAKEKENLRKINQHPESSLRWRILFSTDSIHVDTVGGSPFMGFSLPDEIIYDNE